MPEQFSFICTFRTRKLPKSPWHIIRVTDVETKPQFLITLNPRKQTIEFSLPNYEGRLQTLIFDKANVHYLIKLFVNCIYGEIILGFRQKLAQTSFRCVQRTCNVVCWLWTEHNGIFTTQRPDWHERGNYCFKVGKYKTNCTGMYTNKILYNIFNCQIF